MSIPVTISILLVIDIRFARTDLSVLTSLFCWVVMYSSSTRASFSNGYVYSIECFQRSPARFNPRDDNSTTFSLFRRSTVGTEIIKSIFLADTYLLVSPNSASFTVRSNFVALLPNSPLYKPVNRIRKQRTRHKKEAYGLPSSTRIEVYQLDMKQIQSTSLIDHW